MKINKFEYGIILISTAILHIFLVDYLSFWLFAFFLMLPLVSLVIMIIAGRGVICELLVYWTTYRKNDVVPIHVKVINKYSLLICTVRVKLTIRNELTQDEQCKIIFLTANHTGQTIVQDISSKYCGVINCQISEIRIYDAIGLFSYRKKSVSNCHIEILPTVYPIKEVNTLIQNKVENNKFSHYIKGNDPSEILDIRDYRNGDSLTKIHWKLSQKSDKLMVKELGDPVANDVLILFDINADNSKQSDGLMDTIYSISNLLMENQINFKIQWYDNEDKQMIKANINQKDDVKTAMDHILYKITPQKQLWALKYFISEHNNTIYSIVYYLCCEITKESIDLLHQSLHGNPISILLVASSPHSLGEEDVKLIDLKDLKLSLENLVL